MLVATEGLFEWSLDKIVRKLLNMVELIIMKDMKQSVNELLNRM